MEKRFTQPAPVLNQNGSPNPGWASHGIFQYNRKAIKAKPWRIKEWDWYQINDESKALQFTYGHASYAGQIGVTLFNFETGEKIFNKDIILPLPFSSLNLGTNADDESEIIYDKKQLYLRLAHKNGIRTIECRTSGFEAKAEMQPQNPNALVINIPFDENPKAFYYNHKISCMSAKASCTIGNTQYKFSENTWGLLDWGRGVWPFHNEWYWSSASGRLNGEVFGFNLGCGFGNTNTASENCIFYKNEIHKLGKVNFNLGSSYNDPWHLQDNEGRLNLTLAPVYDRETKIKLLWVDNNTHQMFGCFTGTATLDDGTVLKIDNIIGFAEHAVNNW